MKTRTMHDAVEAGTLFRVANKTFLPNGCIFPAAETPLESATCALTKWPNYSTWMPNGTILTVVRLTKYEIGCAWVDGDSELSFIVESGEVKPVTPMIVRSYSTVTEESRQDGDAAEHGWADFSGNQFPIDHNKPETIHFDLALIGHDCTPDEFDIEDDRNVVDNAIKFLQDDCYVTEASGSHFHTGIWYSAEPDQDMESGDDTTYDYHLKGFTPDQERAIFNAIKGKR